jgi:hypothetical protein
MGRLRESRLEPDRTNLNLACAEPALFRHPAELVLGISPLDQHAPEGPACHPRVDPAPPALLHISINFIERDILAKVCNHRLAPGPQNAVHFVQSLDRL